MDHYNKVIKTLNEMQDLIFHKSIAKTIKDIRNQDITIFLGNTRAGKSTTVNYVLGNSLQAIPESKKKFKIEKNSTSVNGPIIGKGSTSKTSTPTAWPSTSISGIVVDAPGFDDNRGPAQDIANAFYIKEIIENALSVKFVLISDISDVTGDNVAQFCKLINSVHTIFPQADSLLKGTLIVFTKDEDSTTKDEVCDYLKEKIVNSDLKFQYKNFVKYFVENKKQVVIVEMPKTEGLVTSGPFSDLLAAIESTIKKLPKDSIVGLSLGISEKSRCFLYDARMQLGECRKIEEVLKKIDDGLSHHLARYSTHEDSVELLNSAVKELTSLHDKINKLLKSNSSTIDLLRNIKKTIPALTKKHDLESIDKTLKFLKFVDNLLQMSASDILLTKVKSVLSSNLLISKTYVLSKKEKIDQIVKEEDEKKAKLLAAELQALQLLQQQQQNTIDSLRPPPGCGNGGFRIFGIWF